MRTTLKWASLVVLFLLFSCTHVEEFGDISNHTKPGVYGSMSPVLSVDEPDSKASVNPETLGYVFEIGDHINIWANSGTLLIYTVEEVSDEGHKCKFIGGGFTLTENETYHSAVPLIRKFNDNFHALTTTFEDQVQLANGDASHLVEYTYGYASAKCVIKNEVPDASFSYSRLNAYMKFELTLPKQTLTLKKLEIYVQGNEDFFGLNGTSDIATGAFTAVAKDSVMVLQLGGAEGLEVTDGLLNAYLAIAPTQPAEYIIRLTDIDNKVYTSPKIQKNAIPANKFTRFTTEVFEGETPGVAKIGDVAYPTLKDAVAAVPTDGTETTITMIGNDNINVVGSAITIAATKNIILDLNGHQVVGTAEEGSTSALITNKGTLTIKDSSDTNKDGTGSGQLISGATTTWIYEGDGNYAGSYASNTITNSGTLTIESGYIENLSTGSATYAVDNNSSGADAILNMNGGLLKAHSVAVRQFANSATVNNTVNVTGGKITAGYSGIWIQLPGSDATKAMKAALNVTGGILEGGNYAFYDYSYGNSFDATQYNLAGGTYNGDIFSYGANFSITDGTYNGDVAIKQTNPSTVSVSGGKFAGDVWTFGANASKGFITGGVYAINTYEDEGEILDCDWLGCIADGYMAGANTDPATMTNYPYAVIKDTNVYVAKIGDTKYLTLAAAFEAVPTGGEEPTTITLLDNLTESAQLLGNKNIVLDLNGKTLTGSISLYDSKLEVENGTIAGTVRVYGGATSGTDYNTFTVGVDATITSAYGIILYQSESNTAYGSTININGTVNGMVWVMGNITNGDSEINVNSGATVKGDLGVALNGFATVNVAAGATLEGTESGIEVRAGTLNVAGGTIKSTASTYTVVSAGSGTTTIGAAIAVAQHTTNLPVNVNISGTPTLTGVKTISVADPENTGMENVTVTVADVLLGANVVIPAGYGWVSNGNSTSTLAPCSYVAQVGTVQYETLAEAVNAAAAGQTIELLADITSETGNMMLKEGVTLDGKGKTISGDIAININKNGGTIQNVNFKNIHNASNQKSAVYSTDLEGTATITGCTFDNCDWDAIQITPVAGANVVITGNTFSDDTGDGVQQQRYIHVQSAQNVDFSATITENVMPGRLAQEPIGVYYPTDKTKINLTSNYIETVNDICILLTDNDGYAGELVFPSYTTADKEETYTPEAYIQNGKYAADFYNTFAEAATAAGNDKVITLVTNIAGTYTMSEGQTLKVKKNGKTFNKPNGPDGFWVDSSTADGVTTYTLSEADLEYTTVNGVVSYKAWSSTVVSGSGTYKLIKDVTASARIAPGVMATTVTLDLNGHTLTSTATDCAIILSRNGSESSPKIFNLIDSSNEKGGELKVNPAANNGIEVTGNYNQVTIGEGVTIDGNCVALLSENQTLTVNGTINGGNDFAVATNGSSTKNTTITINESAVLTSNETAMYLPGNIGLKATVNGGTITGAKTGIELRAGQLVVNGGSITSTATEYKYTPNNNGTTTRGAAIAVVQHTTKLPIDAQILGGTLTGLNQIAVVDAQDNGLEDVSVQAKDNLVVTTKIPAGFIWVSDGSKSTLSHIQTVIDEAPNGSTITLSGNLLIDKQIVVGNGKNIVLDLNGKDIYNTSDIWAGDDWSLISVQGGNLTITGDGVLRAKENDCYAVDIRNGGELTIENGTYYGNISAVYAYEGMAYVNGGEFYIQQLATNVPDDQSRYLLNCRDESYQADPKLANIFVSGGIFCNFNPGDNQAEGVHTNFLTSGHTVSSVVDGSDTIYTVQ